MKLFFIYFVYTLLYSIHLINTFITLIIPYVVFTVVNKDPRNTWRNTFIYNSKTMYVNPTLFVILGFKGNRQQILKTKKYHFIESYCFVTGKFFGRSG